MFTISITCVLQGTSDICQDPEMQGICKNMGKLSLYSWFSDLHKKQVAKEGKPEKHCSNKLSYTEIILSVDHSKAHNSKMSKKFKVY